MSRRTPPGSAGLPRRRPAQLQTAAARSSPPPTDDTARSQHAQRAARIVQPADERQSGVDRRRQDCSRWRGEHDRTNAAAAQGHPRQGRRASEPTEAPRTRGGDRSAPAREPSTTGGRPRSEVETTTGEPGASPATARTTSRRLRLNGARAPGNARSGLTSARLPRHRFGAINPAASVQNREGTEADDRADDAMPSRARARPRPPRRRAGAGPLRRCPLR